jgi:hypothetical protein
MVNDYSLRSYSTAPREQIERHALTKQEMTCLAANSRDVRDGHKRVALEKIPLDSAQGGLDKRGSFGTFSSKLADSHPS